MARSKNDSVLSAIDVWDLRTFHADLLEVLDEHSMLIRAYFDVETQIFLSHDRDRGSDLRMQRPVNPRAAEYYDLINAVRNRMASRAIRAFHYTRLTDNEVAEIWQSGIHLSTLEAFRHRLDEVVASGELTADIADRLYGMSVFHSDQQEGRVGKFWMVSHPVAIKDSSVEALIKCWGGEVASFWVSDAGLSAQLTKVGEARIIEIAAPLDATDHAHAASKAVVATFGRTQGDIPEKSAFDLYVKTPIPTGAVLAVHTEGEAMFAAMGRTYPAGFVDVDAGRWKELTGEDD